MSNSTTYLKYIIKFLKYTSMYNVSQIENGAFRLLLYVSRVVSNLLNLFLIYGTWMYMMKKGLEDIHTFPLVSFFFLAGIIMALRLNYFYIYDHISESIIKNLNKIFIYTTTTGLEEKDMEHYVYFTNKFSLIYVAYISIFGVLYHFIPVINAFILGRKRVLPLPVYCPYDCETSPFFEVTVLEQTILEIVIVIGSTIPDLFYWTVLYLISGQFELLGWELKNSLYTVLLLSGFEKKLVLKFKEYLSESGGSEIMKSSFGSFRCMYDMINTEQFTKDHIKRVGELMDLYQRLVKFCDDVNTLFSPMIFAWCIFTIFLNAICSFLFLVRADVVVLINSLVYYFSLVFTLLCPCLLVELVKIRSEQLQDILYSTEWYICSEKFKKVILLMQLRFNKPVVFTVGKFTILNLSVFVWIMKTSYSYFTILRQIVDMKHP